MSLRYTTGKAGTLCDDCGRFYEGENLEGQRCPSDDCPGHAWVIRGVNELADDGIGRLFWSNSIGWCPLLLATRFSYEDTIELNLPTGGEWIKESDA